MITEGGSKSIIRYKNHCYLARIGKDSPFELDEKKINLLKAKIDVSIR